MIAEVQDSSISNLYIKEIKGRIDEVWRVISHSKLLSQWLLFSNKDYKSSLSNHLFFRKALFEYLASINLKPDLQIEGKEVSVEASTVQLRSKIKKSLKKHMEEEQAKLALTSFQKPSPSNSNLISKKEETNNNKKPSSKTSSKTTQTNTPFQLVFKVNKCLKERTKISCNIKIESIYIDPDKGSSLCDSSSKSKKFSEKNADSPNFLEEKEISEDFLCCDSNSGNFSGESIEETPEVPHMEVIGKKIPFDHPRQPLLDINISLNSISSTRRILLVIDSNTHSPQLFTKIKAYPEAVYQANPIEVVPNFLLLEDIIRYLKEMPIYSNEESLIISSYKQKVFDFISNFNNIKKLNPELTSLELFDKDPNKIQIKINGKFEYSIKINEVLKPMEKLNSNFSEDWILRYTSCRNSGPQEDHEVKYTVKTITKNYCLVFLKFSFFSGINPEILKEIQTQQVNNLLRIKKCLEEPKQGNN